MTKVDKQCAGILAIIFTSTLALLVIMYFVFSAQLKEKTSQLTRKADSLEIVSNYNAKTVKEMQVMVIKQGVNERANFNDITALHYKIDAEKKKSKDLQHAATIHNKTHYCIRRLTPQERARIWKRFWGSIDSSYNKREQEILRIDSL